MGILDELFGGGRGKGFEDLQSQLEQARGLYDPFRQAGLQALPQLQGLFGQDPTDVVNKILGQYQASPGEQFQKQQAQTAMQNQLAAAGLSGSGEAIQRSGQLASGLAGQGQQQFLQNVLGQRQQQIGGLENLFQTGFGATGQEAGLTGQIGQAQFGEDVSKSQALTNLFKAIGQGAGAAFGIPGGAGGAGGFGGAGGAGGAGGMGGFGNLANLFGGGSQPPQWLSQSDLLPGFGA